MKVLAVFAAILAVASAYYAPGLIRTPQFDSAVVTHERLGGNFAYKSIEAPAYAHVSPIVQHVPTPVAVSYAAKPIIAPVTYTSPAEVHVATAPVAVAHAAPAYPYASAYVAPYAAPYAAKHYY